MKLKHAWRAAEKKVRPMLWQRKEKFETLLYEAEQISNLGAMQGFLTKQYVMKHYITGKHFNHDNNEETAPISCMTVGLR